MSVSSQPNPFFALQQEGPSRFPGWGGINCRAHSEFLQNNEASDCLNVFDSREGGGDGMGVLVTRVGYADNPKYDIAGGACDDTATYGPVRMLAKFFTSQVTVSDGITVDFTGSGLNDLTVDAPATVNEIIVLTISQGLPTIQQTGTGLNDLSIQDETLIDGVYVLTMKTPGVPFGWHQKAYTGGTGPAPVIDEVVTGATSGSTAKVAMIPAPTSGSWTGNDAAGMLYFSDKSAAFQAEQVNCAGGGHFHIAGDFVPFTDDVDRFGWTKNGVDQGTVILNYGWQTIGAITVKFAAYNGHTVGDTFTIQPDEFDWTHDGVVGNTGVVITGASAQIGTTGLYVTFGAITGHTVGDSFSIDPISIVKRTVQVLRLVQTEPGPDKSKFQKWNPATGAWVDITTGLGNFFYPEWIILGVPIPKFCWIDPQNGLHVYDGVTDTKQEIPKCNDTGNITGALWLTQTDDGRLVVGGNVFDQNQANVLYYCAPNDTTKWTGGPGGVEMIYLTGAKGEVIQPRWITGLTTFQGMIVAFSEDMRHVVYGLGSAGRMQRAFPHQGCWSSKCIVEHGDYLYWWGKTGAFKWNGGEPEKISGGIFAKLSNLKITSAHKWFSYIDGERWVTCVEFKAPAYTWGLVSTGCDYAGNLHCKYQFVYNFETGRWHITDVPMLCAFSSRTGVLDSGGIYFSSGVPTLENTYRTYRLGYDDLTGRMVYADNVRGPANARMGTAIRAAWITGKLSGASPNDAFRWKEFKLLHTRLSATESTGLTESYETNQSADPYSEVVGGAWKKAVVNFRLNDTATWYELALTEAAATPYHAMSFLGVENSRGDYDNKNHGNYVEIMFEIIATKRTEIMRAFVEYKLLEVTEHLG